MRVPHHYLITAQARFSEPVDFRKTDLDTFAPPEPIYSFIYQTKLVAESESLAKLRFREDHLYPGAERVKILTVQRTEVYDARRHREACVAQRPD